MSFPAIQALLSGKTPFWLFEFVKGGVTTRLTTHDQDIETGVDAFAYTDKFALSNVFPQTWTATKGLSRTRIPFSTDAGKSTLSVSLPNSNAFARQFLTPAGLGSTTLAIYKCHRTDPQRELQIKYRGDLFQVKPGDPVITLDFGADSILMDSKALVRVMQQNCAHAVYFGGCGLSLAAHETGMQITAGSGVQYTVPGAVAQPDGTYRAGILRWGSLQEMIISHSGSAITLAAPIPGLADEVASASPVDVYLAPGCDLTLGTCVSRFGNQLNFGGFPWMDDTPFDGRSIV